MPQFQADILTGNVKYIPYAQSYFGCKFWIYTSSRKNWHIVVSNIEYSISVIISG